MKVASAVFGISAGLVPVMTVGYNVAELTQGFNQNDHVQIFTGTFWALIGHQTVRAGGL